MPAAPTTAGRGEPRRDRPALVSVVVPMRDAGPWIGAQLDALAAQVFDGEWELVVVDNGSTDDGPALVRDATPQFPALHLVRAVDGRGPAYARNAGMAAASGDFFAFCDADDVVEPGWLAAMAEAARYGDQVGGVLDERTLNDPSVRARRELLGESALPTALDFHPYASSGNSGVWRDVVDAVGGWDEAILAAEDVEFSWRMQTRGYRLVFQPDAVIRYRHRASARGLIRQAYVLGRNEPALFARFAAHGLPPTPLREALAVWARLLATAPLAAVSPARRPVWARRLARRWGRLVTSVRLRKAYL